MGVQRAGRVLSIGLLVAVFGAAGTSCATAPRLLSASGGPSPSAPPSAPPTPTAPTPTAPTPAAPTPTLGSAPAIGVPTPADPTPADTSVAPTPVATSAVPTPAAPTQAVPTPAAGVADPITAGAAQDFTIKHRKIVRVGSAVILPGIEDGEQITVTLKHTRTSGVVDALDASQSQGLIAVEFVITNSGKIPYDDAPDNCANVITGTGKRLTDEVDGSTLTPAMPTTIKLAPKQSITGWISFRLPAGQTLAAVQFVADSGFSDTAADWKIG